MFASNLFRDDAEVRQFLADVELDLRDGRLQDAIERVDFALGVLEEFSHPIAQMCRAYPPSAFHIHGWDKIAARLASLDQPDRFITAIGIDLSSHDNFYVDADDAIAPYLKTSFYSDNAFAFSTADRATICAGYRSSASDWASHFEETDGTIEISGVGRLNFAIDALEREHRLESTDDPLVSDALVFAVAYRAVAVHHAVRTMIETYGLPRPLTILVGSDESYPFFNAPVITASEYSERFALQHAHQAAELSMPDESTAHGAPSDKPPVDDAMVIEATAEPATEDDKFKVHTLDDKQAEPVEPVEVDAWAIDEDMSEVQQDMTPIESSEMMPLGDQYRNPDRQLSGSEIRRRFAESNIVIEPTPKSGLLNRLFGRS